MLQGQKSGRREGQDPLASRAFTPAAAALIEVKQRLARLRRRPFGNAEGKLGVACGVRPGLLWNKRSSTWLVWPRMDL